MDNGQRDLRRGFLNPRIVTKISFWTTSACILVAVVACLLAIWNFAGTDVLWRTVATCAVIGGGMIAFYVINAIFDRPSESSQVSESPTVRQCYFTFLALLAPR